MKVRVKEGQKGFIYGVLRNEGEEFTLKDVKHSVKKDSKGEPVVNPAAKQFSKIWMDKVGGEPKDAAKPKEPSDMKVSELKAALEDAGAEVPEGALKPELVKLLEDSLAE